MHLKLRLRRIEQRSREYRDVGADGHRLAVERDHKTRDALDAGHRKDSLVDSREVDRPSERPAQSVLAPLERVKVVEKSLSYVEAHFADDFRIDLDSLIGRTDYVQFCGQQPSLIQVRADGSKGPFAWHRRRSVA